ncbi:Ferric reductase transmembrane component 3 [Trametes pubescens]|uniref:Ferric reductase transmembrane component 3 n=1 Tax=Trametes pubescens TaxID=154538 RepID=A0A1M2V4Z8_TRAPU|nr:Ferric reductase transmembrane component 3 [Trametes pubescens]
MSTGSNSTVSAAAVLAAKDQAIGVPRNIAYTHQLWWFVASFIGLIAVGQFLSWISSRLFAPSSREEKRDAELEGRRASRARRFSWSRLPIALVNHFRVLAFRNTVDVGQKYTYTYAEVCITVGYVIALFTWEFVNTTGLAGSTLTFGYWSGRAAALSVSQIPLITALGTKNSIFAYITGVSYDKLNFFHRMVARVVFILLWVHACSKIATIAPASYKEWYIRAALTAITAFTILMVVSYRSIRSRYYEFFFFTHFTMVLIFLIGGYYHAKQLSTFSTYIWPSFLIWGIDRFCRFLRLAYYNSYIFSAAPRPPTGIDASVELLSAQFVRLRFPRPSQLKWTPGQAAFLIMPSVSTIPFEAHPFTIASVDSRYRLRGKSISRIDSLATLTDPRDMRDAPESEELQFMINVREGFTKRLAQAAETGRRVKVFVDGPYGFSPSLSGDDTVVLVAGGSGISLVLSMFLGLVSDVQNGKSRCRRVVFIWSIRDPKQLDWISETMGKALELAPEQLDVSVRIFMTGRGRVPDRTPIMDGDDASASAYEMMPPAMEIRRPLLSFAAVQVDQGRPELSKLLKDEVLNTVGRISVTVCGGQTIAKSCRDALQIPFSQSLYGGPSVVLHVESFGYA